MNNLFFCLLLMTVMLFSPSVNAAELNWQTNLADAIKLAKHTKKLVMVDLYTDWCGWCKKMEDTTLSDDGVVDMLNKDFVCVRLNAEDKGKGQQFAKKHNVRGFPCFIFIEVETGLTRATSYGYRGVDEFTDMINKILHTPKPL